MSQEDMKQNDRGFQRVRPRDDNNTPKKGPRFSIYWVWGAIAAVLIGFNLYGSFTPDAKEINQLAFTNMLTNGDVESYTVVTNKNLVKVNVKKESLEKPYIKNLISKNGTMANPVEKGPHFQFSISKPEQFEQQMADFFEKNPNVPQVAYWRKQEGDWLAPILNFILPLLIIVLIWVLLMRKMGGGAGGGAG